jgi:hypothetical protein
MDKHKEENILIDYISEEIFEKTWDYEYNTGARNPDRYMEVNVAGIGDLESIEIAQLNLIWTRDAYLCTIKHKDLTQYTAPVFFTMTEIANYVANYIGSNLIWVDI